MSLGGFFDSTKLTIDSHSFTTSGSEIGGWFYFAVDPGAQYTVTVSAKDAVLDDLLYTMFTSNFTLNPDHSRIGAIDGSQFFFEPYDNDFSDGHGRYWYDGFTLETPSSNQSAFPESEDHELVFNETLNYDFDQSHYPDNFFAMVKVADENKIDPNGEYTWTVNIELGPPSEISDGTSGTGGGDGGQTTGETSGTGGGDGGQTTGGAVDPTSNPIEAGVGVTKIGTSQSEKIVGSKLNDDLQGLGGPDKIKGKKGDDLIDGGEGNDKLLGNAGADTIYGYDGDDKLMGHSGKDYLAGEDGSDRISGGKGADTIFGGFGNDTVKLGGQNDYFYDDSSYDFYGDDDDDFVFGGGGSDYLQSTSGNDTLVGGKGADFFDFIPTSTEGLLLSTAPPSVLTIRDFEVGKDEIWLIESLMPTGADAATLASISEVQGDDLVLTFSTDDQIVVEGITDIYEIADSVYAF